MREDLQFLPAFEPFVVAIPSTLWFRNG